MSVKMLFDFKKTPEPKNSENGFALKSDGDSTVILIHGLTGTPHEMKFLAHYLNRKGYSVVCPRLANHGEPIGVLRNTKWQTFYESVRKTFLNLCASNHHRSVFVAGLSMGALLALLLAEEFPEAIAGVSGLSPTLFYDGWNIPWTKCLLPLAYWTPLRHVLYFKEEPPYGIKNEAIRQRVHEYYRDADLNDLNGVVKYGYPYFPATLFRELRLLVKHLEKKLPRIKMPVQLIQAKEDDITSVKNSEFIYHRIRSEIKEIFLLENSYHVITADQERETVAQAIGAFFDRVKNQRRSGVLGFAGT